MNDKPIPQASLAAVSPDISRAAIRFLEERVSKDPDDFIALNSLAERYHLKLRETGNPQWLELARRAAEASLKAMPEDQNTRGLALLAQVQFASHGFASARDHARRLTELDPRKSYPYLMLGDALLELGDYEGAEKAFQSMERYGPGLPSTEIRLGRMAWLRGDAAKARAHYATALRGEAEVVPSRRESLAWLRWQLGELAFETGDYVGAEVHYRDALTTFPDYYRALAGLGRARAAQGDLSGAIEQYEHATRILPDPSFIATLGDLYRLAGRLRDADAQHALCEKLVRAGAPESALNNRQMALFYADHDLKPAEALQLARQEYELRQDIHGADVFAWALHKAGQSAEAQRLISQALRLGTREARLLYHAGMIARAAGERTAAREYLQQALSLSPQFDPWHAAVARRALAE